MIEKHIARATLAALLFLSSVPLTAASPPLYYSTRSVHTTQFKTCLSFAKTVMEKLKLSDIKTSPHDVAGRTANTHSAITCVGTGQGMVAVIMVAGDNDEALKLRAEMADKIAGIVPFD